jgi:hypothetical protein
MQAMATVEKDDGAPVQSKLGPAAISGSVSLSVCEAARVSKLSEPALVSRAMTSAKTRRLDPRPCSYLRQGPISPSRCSAALRRLNLERTAGRVASDYTTMTHGQGAPLAALTAMSSGMVDRIGGCALSRL